MNKILLFFLLLSLGLKGYSQEQTTVTGTVLSEDDGKPIPGASVFVDKSGIGEQSSPGVIQNTVIGAMTDMDGHFTLKVPAGTTYLKVSYLGYNTAMVNITNKTKITVSLTNDNKVLSEVIVNGYTDISKRKNTTSIAKVDYDKIRQTGVAGIDQMLEGQVAGVAVGNLTGGPGAAPQIRIRGTVSLNGSQDPLWVLDGLPLDGTNLPNTIEKDNIDQLRNLPIAGLNPDDIADITILKDAAATAIYGARAANGVIVITTKKGKKGPMAINFSANTFISERPDLSKLNLMNATEKVDFELGMANRTDLDYRAGNGEIARILKKNGELNKYRTGGFSALNSSTQEAINALRADGTDWGKEIYQNAINQQYTLGLSGGSDQATYYFSGGYYNEKGTTKQTGLERYNMTLKTDFNISQKLKAGAAVFGSKTTRSNYLADVDAFTNLSTYTRNVNPYQTVRNATGGFNYDPDIFGNRGGDAYIPFNAVEERENTRYTLDNKSLKAILDLSYQIHKNLNLRTELGLQFEDTGIEKFGGQDSYYTRKYRQKYELWNSSTKKYESFIPQGGTIYNQNANSFQYNWKTILEYKKVFAEKHEIEALAGTEFRRTNNEAISTRAFGFNERTLTSKGVIYPDQGYANASDLIPYKKEFVENAYASFYSTLSYTYDRKYTAYGSIRYDGSDLFGVDPKYRYLPIYSLSGAWNASEEQFIKNISWISSLRVRTSYGLQGNIDKSTSPFVVGTYTNTGILPGPTQPTIGVTSPPNNKLRWEKTSTFNAGVDFGIFKNAVQVTFDYYNRFSKDLIGVEELQQENGFDFTSSNFSQLRNKGLELTISTRNLNTANFSWSTDFNIAHNKSKVIREKVRPNQFMPSKEGYPVNGIWVIKTDGLDKDGLPIFVRDGKKLSLEEFYGLYDPNADVEWLAGYAVNSKYTGKAFQDLYTYAGDGDAQFIGGLTNRFRYSNFDLSISALFNINKLVRTTPTYNPSQVDRGRNYSRDILNAWSPTNTGSTLPGIYGRDSFNGDRWMAYSWQDGNDPAYSYQALDIFVKNMSYVRINSIRLGYTMPAAIAGKVKANSLRISLEARNPFVIGTDYKGYFDPETYGNIYAQPITRSISVGLNATF
ncbi:MAG: SusC/RagA family TonB-linked outer membrane protein [Candidatus Pedobacter colombiensis]|uniref:SusC/RagA family TonB-linked outer membrane protein n=1 Tax=Candidatus Pedobacter colombiensis TaxID=3121371 RepID=A0AAJ6B7J7_9SPHI|nr:SusC/RagA family TonB-linked outer membrane protein [Pedobacter sp.]WEK19924.1 MAG: SusC/RagA family TonB-linked outer membrane protein [Pedobacter sp.]